LPMCWSRGGRLVVAGGIPELRRTGQLVAAAGEGRKPGLPAGSADLPCHRPRPRWVAS
jgi:hypothetical protein